MGVDQRIHILDFASPTIPREKRLLFHGALSDSKAQRNASVPYSFNDLPRVDNITFGFGHLLAVLVQNMACRDNRFVRRFAVKQGRYRQQAVEPATCLVNPFTDHISRILVSNAALFSNG